MTIAVAERVGRDRVTITNALRILGFRQLSGNISQPGFYLQVMGNPDRPQWQTSRLVTVR